WEQAEAVLQQEDDRRRRRGGLLWSLLLLLLMLLLGWWFLSQQHSGFTQKEPEPNQEQTAINSTVSTQTEVLSRPATQASNQHSTNTNENGKSNNAPFKTTNQNSGAAKSSRSQAFLPGKNPALNPVRDRNGHWKMTAAKSVDQDGLSDAEGGDAKGSTEKAEQLTQATSLVLSQTAENSLTTSEPGKVSSESQTSEVSFPFIPVAIIRIQAPLLPMPEKVLPFKKQVNAALPLAEKIKPAREPKKWSAGISLAGSVNTPDQSNRRLGMAPGLFVRYELNNSWAVGIGGQYRITPGYDIAGQDSTSTEIIRYSFGFKKSSYESQTRALHHLEIPFSIQWNRNRIGLEGGAGLGFVTMVQQRIESTYESSLEPIKTQTHRFGVGDRSLYKPYYLTGFLGASYRVSNRWACAVRAHYRFTDLEQPVEGRELSRPGFVDFGVRFRLY
ncbi:MAG TPA: hypothetical protein DCF33_18465, partial [Saprospirales bacterium]|nr:hypothetical protein [Saprospirales bacterium]